MKLLSLVFILFVSFSMSTLEASFSWRYLDKGFHDSHGLKRLSNQRRPITPHENTIRHSPVSRPYSSLTAPMIQSNSMVSFPSDNIRVKELYNNFRHLPFQAFMNTCDENTIKSLKAIIKDNHKDSILTDTTLGERPYGIRAQAANYWKERSFAMKVGIMFADDECREAYKGYLSHFSDKMQSPDVSLNAPNEEMEARTHYWSLLAFEDPISRKYLAQQYEWGVLVPHNPTLSQFWKEYKDDFLLPALMRKTILQNTPFYPFKEGLTLPKAPNDWKDFFPTSAYFKDLDL